MLCLKPLYPLIWSLLARQTCLPFLNKRPIDVEKQGLIFLYIWNGVTRWLQPWEKDLVACSCQADTAIVSLVVNATRDLRRIKYSIIQMTCLSLKNDRFIHCLDDHPRFLWSPWLHFVAEVPGRHQSWATKPRRPGKFFLWSKNLGALTLLCLVEVRQSTLHYPTCPQFAQVLAVGEALPKWLT